MLKDSGPEGLPNRRASVERSDESFVDDSFPALRQRLFQLLDDEAPADVDEFMAFTLAVAQAEPNSPEAQVTLQNLLKWDRRQVQAYFAEFQLYQDPAGINAALVHAQHMPGLGEGDDVDNSDSYSSSLDISWSPDEPSEDWRSSL